jgi:hypothetical protein
MNVAAIEFCCFLFNSSFGNFEVLAILLWQASPIFAEQQANIGRAKELPKVKTA